jgi:hypothetical protein
LHGPVEDRLARINASLPWPSSESDWRNPLLGNGIAGKGHALAILSNIMGAKKWSGGLASKFKVDVDDESDLPNSMPQCLQATAVALNAYSGFLHSTKAAGQIVSDDYCRSRLEAGILHFSDQRTAIFGLSWVNYLGKDIAGWLEFPNAEDRQRLSLLDEVPSKGWLFSLTEEPLDLDVPFHRDAIRWAFERFSD